MRSARTLLAAGAATAALAVAAPGAYASSAGEGDKDDHSYSSDHEYKKDEYKEAGGEHDKPKGGMHTGGGGLATSGSTPVGELALLGGLGAGAYVLRRRISRTLHRA
ncbi:hypothetical protein ACIBVL_25905 [Streptomyces sp. NPDC049687]|uniref:hypothetical protein n=1 Tax=Streptomyces sp. NPDC049687 TaxID=3365596 RepID=UPI0037A925F0